MSAGAARAPERLRVVLVSGLSGGGKASILRVLEDIGYEAVDNPPLRMLDDMVARSERKLAIGVDARTRGFDAGRVLETLARARANPALRPELVFAWADEATLLRRYTETRRRHPMAPQGRVSDGIAAGADANRAAAEPPPTWSIDTSELPLAELRQLIERTFRRRQRCRGQPPGGLADFLRLPAGPAARSRPGIRRALFAQSALRSHIAAAYRTGSRGRRLYRGGSGLHARSSSN